MKEILLNSLKLCIITLISGLLLGVVYEVTKEPRAEQEEKSKQEAYAKVFAAATSFEELEYNEKEMEDFIAEYGYKRTVAYIDGAVSARDDDGNVIGYVITVTDKEGYGGEIQFTIGIQKDGTINGLSFLTLAETAGVGMKAADNKFKSQFEGKKADSFEYTKNGASSENQIDAISGATITTNAVTNGVNVSILAYKFISGESQDGIEESKTPTSVENESDRNGGKANE